MKKGWIVTYSDGNQIQENHSSWQELPNKKDIVRVSLKWEDKFWHIDKSSNVLAFTSPGKRMYFDSANPGVQRVHSRTIGWYESEFRYYYRVEEATGKMIQEYQSVKD